MPGHHPTFPTRSLRTAAALALAASLLGGAALAASGDRTLDLYNMNTEESLKVTFMRNGRYDPQALEQLNWFLRDWRLDKPAKMDPELFITVWEVYRRSGSKAPIQVHSGFRSKTTNAMLRRRSRAVAEHSQHSLGKALDFHLPDVPSSRLRAIAMQMQEGGVGFYPRANFPFVHVDVGSVRHWPRMTRSQLAGLFPDGKTLHIPSDGKPMPGFEMAKAEIEADEDEDTVVAEAGPSFLQKLFGGGTRQASPQAEAPVVVAEAAPARKPARAAARASGKSAETQAKAVSGLRVTPDGYIVGGAEPETASSPARSAAPAPVIASAPASAPLPPRAPARQVTETRVAAAPSEDKAPVKTSSSVSGISSMDALFASIVTNDRKIPQNVLGYAALPTLAFMPPPVSLRSAADSSGRPPVAQGREPSLITADLWNTPRTLSAPAGDRIALAPQMGPSQTFAPPATKGVFGPSAPSRTAPTQGEWTGLERPRLFSLLRWLLGE